MITQTRLLLCLHRHLKCRYSVLRCLKRKYSVDNNQGPHVDSTKGPLHGLRVLDLTRILAGPYCSMILGDLGAEIIKIEKPGNSHMNWCMKTPTIRQVRPAETQINCATINYNKTCYIPGEGDDTRTWGPPFCNTESAYFLSINRNKKSVAVNMKKKEGQDIIKQLAVKSDILLENFVPGKLSELGLGYEQLAEIAPSLVYCSITGYGQTGPDSQRAGYDVIVAATAGLTHITGPKDGEPCKVGVAMTDLSTGLYAYGSIMAALWHRLKTGLGQHIDCNLLSTQVASLVNIASNYLNSGMEATRHGTAHQSIVPYQAFPSQDGYIMIGGGNDKLFQILCKRIGMPELGEDPDFATNSLRVTNRDRLIKILSEKFRTKSSQHWQSVLEGSGVPYGPINNMQQVFSEPQVIYNGMIQEMPHPVVGTVRVAGPAVRFSETPTVLNHPPPLLGQHTDLVLQDIIGLGDTELQRLRSKGVIQ